MTLRRKQNSWVSRWPYWVLIFLAHTVDNGGKYSCWKSANMYHSPELQISKVEKLAQSRNLQSTKLTDLMSLNLYTGVPLFIFFIQLVLKLQLGCGWIFQQVSNPKSTLKWFHDQKNHHSDIATLVFCIKPSWDPAASWSIEELPRFHYSNLYLKQDSPVLKHPWLDPVIFLQP